MPNYLSVAAVKTPPKKTNSQREEQQNATKAKNPKYGDVSVRDLSRELGYSSYGSAQRNLLKAEEKPSLIADGKVEGWVVLEEREVWNKMPDELKDAYLRTGWRIMRR